MTAVSILHNSITHAHTYVIVVLCVLVTTHGHLLSTTTTKKNKAWTLFGATFVLGLPLPVRYRESSLCPHDAIPRLQMKGACPALKSRSRQRCGYGGRGARRLTDAAMGVHGLPRSPAAVASSRLALARPSASPHRPRPR
jgi:hypothetical protein